MRLRGRPSSSSPFPPRGDRGETDDRPAGHALRRRIGAAGLAGLVVLALPGLSRAAGLDRFSQADMTAALRQALEKGVGAAVAQLGVADGFRRNEAVRIGLPDGLRHGERLLRLAGRGDDLDRLVDGMNRAAELSVAQARPLLLSTVRALSVQDARQILTGGEDAVTQYFRDRTREPLAGRFAPIVQQHVGTLDIVRQYNELADKAGRIGLVRGDAASVEQYVTGKALDGLYRTLAEQERQIRADPLGTGNRLIGRVFGAMH